MGEAGERTRTMDTITSHWVFLRNKLLGKGHQQGSTYIVMTSVFPSNSYVCGGPASQDSCLGVTLTKIHFCWAWLHISWYTLLGRSGQLSQPCPPHEGFLPALSLLPGNMEEWEIKKALMLFKKCSTMNKTLACYQCYFGQKSKAQHQADCCEKMSTPFQTDSQQVFPLFYADERVRVMVSPVLQAWFSMLQYVVSFSEI